MKKVLRIANILPLVTFIIYMFIAFNIHIYQIINQNLLFNFAEYCLIGVVFGLIIFFSWIILVILIWFQKRISISKIAAVLILTVSMLKSG